MRLLGRFETGGEPLPSDKRGCLLAYLAHAGTWVEREQLAFLFWPDSDETSAKRNLRQLLNRAKTVQAAQALEITSTRVRWPVESDVAAFRQALARSDWSEAMVLYGSGLLSAFTPPRDVAGFEAWLELERGNLHRAYRQTALKHAQALEADGSYETAAESLKRLLETDELAEDVLQGYLRNAYLSGQRDLALQAFEDFRRRLRSELDLEPLEATCDLVASIRNAGPLLERESVAERQQVLPTPLNVLRPPRTVGRSKVLRIARSARTRFVLLHGEAGAGKSRLLEDLAPQALPLRCREGWQSVPYQPVVTLIRDRLVRGSARPDLGEYLVDLARLVPELMPQATSTVGDGLLHRSRLLEGLCRFLESECDYEATFQVVVDDLQWADESTLELFSFLVERPGLRVLGAARRHEVTVGLERAIAALRSARALTEIELDPLTESDIRQLMSDLAGTPEGPPAFSAWLHQATGGNPMFALETLKSLFEGGVLRTDQEGWHTSIDDVTRDYSELQAPPAVADVIARSVARLADQTVRVLQAASVLRQGFSVELLADICGLSEEAVSAALEEVEAAGLIQAELFRHDLIRQSIYRSMPEGRRRRFHGRAARSLGQGGEPLVLAEHWLAAGEPELAVAEWRRSAERLRGQGLHDEAAEVLMRARGDASKKLTMWGIQADLAATYRQATRFDEAEELVNDLLEHCYDAQLRASALDTRAGLHLHRGRLNAADSDVREGLRLASGTGLERSLRNLEAYVAVHRGQYETARLLLEPVVAAAREAGAEHELCGLLISLASIYDRLGRHEEALPLHLEALALARSSGDRLQQVDSSLNLLYCYTDLDRMDEGLSAAQEALQLGRYEGTDTLRNNLAWSLVELGRIDEGVSHYQTLVRETDDPTLACVAWARLVSLYQGLGRGTERDEALERALDLVDRTELAVARAVVAVSAYRFGSAEQTLVAESLAGTLDREALPPYLLAELEAAVDSRAV